LLRVEMGDEYQSKFLKEKDLLFKAMEHFGRTRFTFD